MSSGHECYEKWKDEKCNFGIFGISKRATDEIFSSSSLDSLTRTFSSGNCFLLHEFRLSVEWTWWKLQSNVEIKFQCCVI